MQEILETRDYTGVKTSQIIQEMLTENTGSALLDSGGAYGRNWERNQGKTFEDQPTSWAEWSTWRDPKKPGQPFGKPELCATISLYHWMARHLRFDADMQTQLEQFAQNDPELEHESWLSIQDQFAEFLHAEDGHKRAPNTINTYNDPDSWDCSQGLQYTELYTDSDYEPSHLIVSVHGGCDVRGGYTAPKCFSLRHDYYEALSEAKIDYVGTTRHGWRMEYPGAYSDDDGAPTKHLFAVPCYDQEWLEDEPQLAELQAHAARVSRERAALKDCGLTPEQLHAAGLQLDAAEGRAEEERTETVLGLLRERHEVCTLVQGKKLFLVTHETVEEVFASANF